MDDEKEREEPRGSSTSSSSSTTTGHDPQEVRVEEEQLEDATRSVGGVPSASYEPREGREDEVSSIWRKSLQDR